MRTRRLYLLLTLCFARLIAAASAQDGFRTPIPLGDLNVRIQDFATVPDSATGRPPRLSVLTPDPSGRLFVNDQRGPLYVIDASSREAAEYLDLRDFRELRITSTSEAGFQSFAFHPDFDMLGSPGFGRFYTIHSSTNTTTAPDFDPGGNTNFHTLLLEWRTDTPSAETFTPADAAQPYREILRFKQPFGNHNAGLIAFNPTSSAANGDHGNLYVALGDGGAGGDPQENGQDPSNPFGAVLRIDPLGNDGINGQYGIVPENVLAADNDNVTLGEIHAYGLRNPQRFGWDQATGNLFIADIGQNAVEEVDLGVNGGNFGWDDREGSLPFESRDTTGLIDPVAEYHHERLADDLPTSINNRAVTVGEVARGTGIPGLDGMLLLSDFPTGLILLLDVDNDPLDGDQDGLVELRPWTEDDRQLHFLDLINEARAERGLSSTSRADLRFGFNTPGEVYLLNKHDGVVRRLAPRTVAIEGDFNQDEQVDLLDIDLLGAAITADAHDVAFDLTGDQLVDLDDLHAFLGGGLIDGGNKLNGDADFSGMVDFNDFLPLAQNFGQSDKAWSQGDFIPNGAVEFDDFIELSSNFGLAATSLEQVPEPSSLTLLFAVAGMAAIRRRRVVFHPTSRNVRGQHD